MAVNTKLKKILKENHITQEALGEKIGKSQRLISHWCNGICQPQIDDLNKIAIALGVTVEEVIKCFE